MKFQQDDLSGLAGKHLVYTYDNGWNYEIYIKNNTTMDYRIHSGIVGNRWVRDQSVYLVQVASQVYKISWTEPTGTDVSLIVNLADKLLHGTIFFPRWIIDNPQKTVCFQNDNISKMESFRQAGPAYPTQVIDEFAAITYVEDCGIDNEEVINCAASDLPENFPENLKKVS